MRPSRLAWFLVLCPAAASAGPPSAPVIGGTDVPDGKWTDTAALYWSGVQECTGTLIAPDVVLTAGHCVFDDSTNMIDPPDHVKLNTNSLAKAGEMIAVKSYTYHKGAYDLGILMLETPSTVTPRRLATGWPQSEIVNGAAVAFAGYGSIDRDGNVYIDQMREATSTITDAGCTDHLGCEPGARPNGELGAGGMGIDTCPGDSGGPLVVKTAYGDFLAGVTSRGYDDNQYYCSEGGIYERPDKAEVVAWIEQQAKIELPVGRGPKADTLEVVSGDAASLVVDADDPHQDATHTWSIVTPPAHGTAEIDAAGKLTVHAAADYTGPDEVTVDAVDGADPTRHAAGRIQIDVVPDDGGCCHSGPAGARVWPALLVLGSLALRRRRARI